MRTAGLRLLTIAFLVLVAAAAFPAFGASAQDDCYPDGCTEPTNPTIPDNDPTVEITPEVEVAGTVRTIVYSDFAPGATVEFTFQFSGIAGFLPLQSTTLGSDVADASGSGELDVTIPAVSEVGDYLLTASDGIDTATDTYTVIASGDEDDDDGALAFTGGTILPLIALALALLGAGFYLVRRNRGAAATA